MSKDCKGCKHNPHTESGVTFSAKCLNCTNHPQAADNYEPADSKVLNAEEWVTKYSLANPRVKCNAMYNRDEFIEAFNTGHKNGRLERDLEYREAIVYESHYCEKNIADADTCILLKNLKPLDKE